MSTCRKNLITSYGTLLHFRGRSPRCRQNDPTVDRQVMLPICKRLTLHARFVLPLERMSMASGRFSHFPGNRNSVILGACFLVDRQAKPVLKRCYIDALIMGWTTTPVKVIPAQKRLSLFFILRIGNLSFARILLGHDLRYLLFSSKLNGSRQLISCQRRTNLKVDR